MAHNKPLERRRDETAHRFLLYQRSRGARTPLARVGWVEAIAETHHNPRRRMMGFAALYPSYELLEQLASQFSLSQLR